VRNQQLGIIQLDLDPFLGHHVGHPRGQHVRPLLIQQGGAFAVGFGLLVFGVGFFFSIDVRFDDPDADLHAHPVNRGARRGGEDVDRLDGLVAGIVEDLVHAHPGHHAGDLDVGRGLLQRQAIDAGIAAAHEEVRGRRLVAAVALVAAIIGERLPVGLGAGLIRRRRNHRPEQQKPARSPAHG
jgi:hypothetical protein